MVHQTHAVCQQTKEKAPEGASIKRKCLILLGFWRQAPGEPNMPRGSLTPNEYLSRALYLLFPVSKSWSMCFLILRLDL